MNENPWIPLLELTGTFFVDDLPELNTEQLLERAFKAKEDAERELAYAETISVILTSDTESIESKKHLATIGVWHFECAVELFEKSVRNFKRAKARGLEIDKEKDIEPLIKKCQKQIVALVEQKKKAGNLLKSASFIQ